MHHTERTFDVKVGRMGGLKIAGRLPFPDLVGGQGIPVASKWSIGSASLGRLISLLAFLPVASRVPDYARLIGALVIDERMPTDRKLLLGAAAGYLVAGRDIIPDSVPLVGGLDDLVVVVLAVDLFLDGVPPELLAEKLDDLAIDRASFDRDIAQIRRLTPGPVRRTIRRIPGLVTAAGRAIERSGIVPRTRDWITKEERSA
jgi:uncharacterized membrane protein YkvA (DUF1232 family)